MKKIAVFDLDKTLYDGASMKDFLFGFLIPQRKIDFVNMVKAIVLVFRYGTGLISHNDASQQTMEISAAVLKGRSVDEVKSWQKNFFAKHHFFEYVPKLFSLLKDNGYKVVIVSASIEPIVTACADVFGVECFASSLETKDGKYLGKIKQLMNEEEKVLAITKLVGDATQHSVLAFGDSSGDIAMLEKADHGFLFEPFESETEAYGKKHASIQLVTRDTIIPAVKKVMV